MLRAAGQDSGLIEELTHEIREFYRFFVQPPPISPIPREESVGSGSLAASLAQPEPVRDVSPPISAAKRRRVVKGATAVSSWEAIGAQVNEEPGGVRELTARHDLRFASGFTLISANGEKSSHLHQGRGWDWLREKSSSLSLQVGARLLRGWMSICIP